MRPGCLIPLDHEARRVEAIPEYGTSYEANCIPVPEQCNVTMVTGAGASRPSRDLDGPQSVRQDLPAPRRLPARPTGIALQWGVFSQPVQPRPSRDREFLFDELVSARL